MDVDGEGATAQSSEEILECELFCNVGICDHGLELVKVEFAISVGVGLHDGLVYDLLQLLVLEIVADHHFEYEEELAVANETVTVHVVYLECKSQFLLPTALVGKGAETGDELLEVYRSATILVENGDQTQCQWVVGNLWDLKKFVLVNAAGTVAIEFHEPLLEPLNLL